MRAFWKTGLAALACQSACAYVHMTQRCNCSCPIACENEQTDAALVCRLCREYKQMQAHKCVLVVERTRVCVQMDAVTCPL